MEPFRMKLSFGLIVLLIPTALCDNEHVAGDNMKAKLLGSFVITAATEPIDLEQLQAKVMMFENDETFEYIDSRDGDPVSFDTCIMLQTEEYFDDGTKNYANCELTRLDADIETIAGRMFEFTFELDTMNPGCGALVKGGLTVFVTVLCQRVKGHLFQYDALKVFAYPLSDIIILEKEVDNSIAVGPIKQVLVFRFWRAILNLIENAGGEYGDYPVNNPVDSALEPGFLNKNNGVVVLGSTMFLEALFDLDDAQSGIKYMFPDNAVGPVGLSLHTCILHLTHAVADFGDITTPYLFIGDDGCSEGTHAFYVGPKDEEYLFHFASDGSTNENKYSPNAVWSKQFEVGFPAKAVAGRVDLKVKCKPYWCMEFDDPMCFYIPGSMAIDQPTCAASRKRRSEETTYPDDWPTSIETQITIQSPDYDIITKEDVEKQQGNCLEKKAFFGITIVLGTLLLVVFSLSLAMFVKIRSYPSEKSSSIESFQNKGYN